MEDENAALRKPRLLLRGARKPATAGAVTWELCYGGVPIATGALGSGEEVAFTDIDAIEPSMDNAGFSFIARMASGEVPAIEAICVRPARPLTRAERTARAKWAGLRDQPETPAAGRQFLAGTRDVTRTVPAGRGTGTRSRCVCVYQHFAVLLAGRRRRVRAQAPPPRRVSQTEQVG
ncbi:MAG TPA: hypothetical protein VGI74_05435 [Streptosporangiaceae bacterium]